MYDSKEILICPACGKEMKKIFLEKQNFNVDICLDGCGGIFLDNRELKKINEISEDVTPILEVIKDKEFNKADENMKLRCPVCSAIMVKNRSGFVDDTIIDECYSCGGVFLNNNELFKIREKSADEANSKADFEAKLKKEIMEFLSKNPE